jgi:hypothetical protein
MHGPVPPTTGMHLPPRRLGDDRVGVINHIEHLFR